MRPPDIGRIFFGTAGLYIASVISRKIRNLHRKIIPGADSLTRKMIDSLPASHIVTYYLDYQCRKVSGRGRCPHLVAHYFQFLLLRSELQHCLDEILPVRRI